MAIAQTQSENVAQTENNAENMAVFEQSHEQLGSSGVGRSVQFWQGMREKVNNCDA